MLISGQQHVKMNYRGATSLMLVLLLLSACQPESGKGSVRLETESYRAADDFPVFSSGGVDYVGISDDKENVDAFLGIPFAQAPVGEQRWQPPKPWHSTETTYVAQNFADACMQGPHLANWYQDLITSFGGDPDSFPLPQLSEDCLYLNIWRPAKAATLEGTGLLPVYVFIHGGSNKGGWSYEPNYIGEQLAAEGAIVVTIGYRLGVFGFFAHPDLDQANFALLDQIAALEWIQKHIAAAGGDPNNITVAGESAGANNIAYLMASPMAMGLFHKVVFESAGWAMGGTTAKTEYDVYGVELATKLSADNSSAGISDLRALPADQVLEAAYEVYQDHFFDPVVDGHSITEPVFETASQGRLAKVNLVLGANANESLMYLAADETVDNWLANNVSLAQAEKIQSALDPARSPRQQLDRIATAHTYVCPSLELAQAVAESGGRAWVYYFTRVRAGQLAEEMGAYHGAELPYIFNTHDDWLPTNDVDRALSSQIMRYWAQFMHQHDPNIDDLPHWPEYRQAGDQILNLGDETRSEVHSSQVLCEILSLQ